MSAKAEEATRPANAAHPRLKRPTFAASSSSVPGGLSLQSKPHVRTNPERDSPLLGQSYLSAMPSRNDPWRNPSVGLPTAFLPIPAVDIRRIAAAELQFKLGRRRQRKTCFRAANLRAVARAPNPLGRFESYASYRSQARVPGQAAISQIDVSRLAAGALTPMNDAARCVLRGSISPVGAALVRVVYRGFAIDLGCWALDDDPHRRSQFSFELRQTWRSVWRQSSTST